MADSLEDRATEWTKTFEEFLKPWILEAAGPDPPTAVLETLSACGEGDDRDVSEWSDTPLDVRGRGSPTPVTPVKQKKRDGAPSTDAPSSKRSRLSREERALLSLSSESKVQVKKRVMTIRIPLPSSLPEQLRGHPSLSLAVDIEMRHRELRADFALNQVRSHLISATGHSSAGPPHPGQTLGTKSQTVVKQKWANVHAHADAYQRARNAMRALGMPENDRRFQPLASKDLVPFVVFTEEEELLQLTAATRAGQRQEQRAQQRVSLNKVSSWIWENLQFTMTDDSSPDIIKYYVESACYMLSEGVS